MIPAQPIESIFSEALRPVGAPDALWDRVWQPRAEAAKPAGGLMPGGLMQGFAFGLPVAFAAALIVMVAVTNPLHSPSGFHAVAPARPGSTEIVSQLERREAVRTISQDRLREAQPARSVAARLEAGCSVCHTL